MKPGYKTTEMYLTALVLLLLFSAFFYTLYLVGSGAISEDLGKWVLSILAGTSTGGGTLLVREYTRSRGLLKATKGD